jgi:hypothetical protein
VSGRRAQRPPGPLAAALASASAWLLEPARPAPERVVSAPSAMRPVIAVFGLARGCGATVVARALAAELANRDPAAAAAVHCEARAAGIPLATPAAGRLARSLADVPGADTKAVGRLCLVGGADQALLADTARHFAPLVLDAGATSLGGVAAAVADEVVLVATPSIEPALATVAAECLGRIGHEPLVAVNRSSPGGGWAGAGRWVDGARSLDGAHPAAGSLALADGARSSEGGRPPGGATPRPGSHPLPESRMGAQLALGGREPRGSLGRAIAELADRICAPPFNASR